MNTIKTIFLYSLLAYSPVVIKGQTKFIDSLRRQIDKTTNAKQKLNLILMLSGEAINSDTLLPYVVIANSIANSLKDESDKRQAAFSQEIINSLRDTTWVLNKDHITITGISDRIKNYVSKLQPTYSHIQFHITEEIKNDVRISSQHAPNIFRIVQVAIHNALKHSGANIINISINSNKTILLNINDDGKGMEEINTTEGNGLLNMQARAREMSMMLSVTSKSNDGTSLFLQTGTTN